MAWWLILATVAVMCEVLQVLFRLPFDFTLWFAIAAFYTMAIGKVNDSIREQARLRVAKLDDDILHDMMLQWSRIPQQIGIPQQIEGGHDVAIMNGGYPEDWREVMRAFSVEMVSAEMMRAYTGLQRSAFQSAFRCHICGAMTSEHKKERCRGACGEKIGSGADDIVNAGLAQAATRQLSDPARIEAKGYFIRRRISRSGGAPGDPV